MIAAVGASDQTADHQFPRSRPSGVKYTDVFAELHSCSWVMEWIFSTGTMNGVHEQASSMAI